MKAGHYQNDPQAVSMMINSSPHIIDELVRYGVDFRHEGSEFAFTREGAHSTPRILYHDDAVSYTHLDVYKRQPWTSTDLFDQCQRPPDRNL